MNKLESHQIVKNNKTENKNQLNSFSNEINENFETIELSLIDPRFNFTGNYDKYVIASLQSMVDLKFLLEPSKLKNIDCPLKQLFDLEDLENIKNLNENYSTDESIDSKSTADAINELESDACISPLMKYQFENVNNETENNINIHTSNKIIVFDLDETLIFADMNNELGYFDILAEFEADGVDYCIPIIFRPYLKEVLESLAQIFEIHIFTAGNKIYADAILNQIDPYGSIFKARHYRTDCTPINRLFKNQYKGLLSTKNLYLKDLQKINENLSSIVLIDNSIYSLLMQLDNGILISSFYGSREDTELVNMFKYLSEYIYEAEDVRNINKTVFGLSSILKQIL